jgi:hypothetical protein
MKNKLATFLALALAVLLGLGQSASAALPSGISDAITSAGADMSTGATAVVAAIITVAALVGASYFIIKLIKRGV